MMKNRLTAGWSAMASMIKANFLLIGISILLISCNKPEDARPVTHPTTNQTQDSERKLFITNEGNFTFGNASVSIYDPDKKVADHQVFQAANGIPLGDVAQSMWISGDTGFVIVNNSGNIEVVDLKDFSRIGRITGLTSPRYMVEADAGKGYVSDLYANGIHVIDLGGMQKTGFIAADGWTEEMVSADGKIFVAEPDTDLVLVIDPLTDAAKGRIQVTQAPSSMVRDADGKVWVLCQGDQAQNILPALHRIDPVTETVEASFTFPSAAPGVLRLALNPAGDELYFIRGGIWRMSIHATALPAAAWLQGQGRLFYGLGVDPQTGEVYASDAVDYVQQGWIYRFSAANAAVVDSFRAGIIPGGFYWHD